MSNTIEVHITKAKAAVTVDMDRVADKYYKAFLVDGASYYLNKGMSKITIKGLDGEKLAEAQGAALKKANENLEAIYNGSMKVKGQKAATKVSGKVMTEARKIAREIVRSLTREAGYKVSHYKAADITAYANKYIESHPEVLVQAEANLKAMEVKSNADLGFLDGLTADPALVAKAEKEAAAKRKGDGTLSAKQAGKVAPRKGKAASTAAAMT